MTYYDAQRKRILIRTSKEDYENDKEYIECCEIMEWVERQISIYACKVNNEVRIETYSNNLKGIDFDIIHKEAE